MKKMTVSILVLGLLFLLLIPASVLGGEALTDGKELEELPANNEEMTAAAIPFALESRGHIQNKGDIPEDPNEWSRHYLGTRGEGLRLEGFQVRLKGEVPEGLTVKYNVHVRNKGWLYAENDFSNWPKNGEFAGTRGQGLRIEAAKFVLVDASGEQSKDYSVLYEGHVQNFGSFPTYDPNRQPDQVYYANGQLLGTVGQSLRLEAIRLEIDEMQFTID